MSKKQEKEKVEKEIRDFFKNIQNKNPRDIKKIKRVAMKHNIKLGNLRKKFCKKCLNPYVSKTMKTRIKNKIKTVTCLNCDYVSRWKIN